jgi:hypothetical protein
VSVGKRQRLGDPIFEDNLDTGLSRLFIRPGKHLWRSVDPVHHARRPDMPFGCNGKGSCSAAHIQDRLARLKARQAENLLAKGLLPTKGQEPNQEIITSGRMQD